MKEIVSDSNWVDEMSRKQLTDKIDQLRAYIFTPESYFNHTFLDQIATSVKDLFILKIVLARKLLDNLINFVKFRWK